MKARVTRGLIVRADPLERILAGTKTWEVRGHRTHLRGTIALIEAGSGRVTGTAKLVDVIGPMSALAISKHSRKTGYPDLPVSYREYFAWVLESPRRLSKPVRYRHPAGAVVWVRMNESVVAAIAGRKRGHQPAKKVDLHEGARADVGVLRTGRAAW